jgi:hypothetical protein
MADSCLCPDVVEGLYSKCCPVHSHEMCLECGGTGSVPIVPQDGKEEQDCINCDGSGWKISHRFREFFKLLKEIRIELTVSQGYLRRKISNLLNEVPPGGGKSTMLKLLRRFDV